MCHRNGIELAFVAILFGMIVTGVIILLSVAYKNSCSPHHESDMRTCLNNFGDSLPFLMPGESYSKILYSWSYVVKACERFPYLEACLNDEIIDNCLTLKQIYNPFSYSSHYTLGSIYHGANFFCRDGYDALKNSVTCASQNCRIDQKNCSTIEKSINKCWDKTKKICNHQKYNIFNLFLRLRECQESSNCHFCKQAFEDLDGILNRWFKNGNNRFGIKELRAKIENLESNDEEIQFTALQEIHKDLSEPRPQTKIYIEIGIVSILIQSLYSTNTSIQHEAIICLQKLVNGKDKNVEDIIATENLPYLVYHILTTDDEKIVEEIIEFFVILITVKPNLHEYYKKLKIVEPLLLSIFPETPKRIKTKISIILAAVSQENDWEPTLETRNFVEELIPLLTEIVNHHDSNVICDIIEGYIGYRKHKNNNLIYVSPKVFETLIGFLGRKDAAMEDLIFKVFGFIKAEVLDDSIIIINNNTLNNFNKYLKHSDTEITATAMTVLTDISTSNEKQIQAIFEANLIPSILKNFESFYLKIRKSAAELISQISINGNSVQLLHLYENDVILKICNYLKETKSQKLAIHLLSAINSFIEKLEEKSEEILTKFAAHGGYDFVQRMSKHKNPELQEIASKLRNFIANGYDNKKLNKKIEL